MKHEVKVWYHNKESKTIKAISEIVSIVEGEFDIIKVIQIRSDGSIDRYSIRNDDVERFFNGFNRVATAKQIETAMLAVNDVLDFKRHPVSKWEV